MAAAPVQLTAKNLARARKYYVDDWLAPLWPDFTWRSVPEFIFWYAIAGFARGGDTQADNALEAARRGHVRRLGARSRELWKLIPQAIPTVARRHPDPLTMLGNDEVKKAIHWLDGIKHIGPKIAAFTLRDLSFLRDAREGDERWFLELPEDWQSVFIPIDQHVHRALRKAKASAAAARHTLPDIQNDVELHLAAGRDLVGWAHKRGFDPRIVNVFWFSYGREDIDKDGNPTPEE